MGYKFVCNLCINYKKDIYKNHILYDVNSAYLHNKKEHKGRATFKIINDFIS